MLENIKSIEYIKKELDEYTDNVSNNETLTNHIDEEKVFENLSLFNSVINNSLKKIKSYRLTI